MSAAIGMFMLLAFLVLGAAKAWSAGYLDSILKGVILGLGASIWLSAALYLILGGAA